jgi:hypothetical protein
MALSEAIKSRVQGANDVNSAWPSNSRQTPNQSSHRRCATEAVEKAVRDDQVIVRSRERHVRNVGNAEAGPISRAAVPKSFCTFDGKRRYIEGIDLVAEGRQVSSILAISASDVQHMADLEVRKCRTKSSNER